ncbi:lactoylglutathione lyase-like lyase [Planoprotostelium fungivorum]|uniref:Lactoylglutathione lyase-like lyase n=1 Tax=Planoprotostelium fungivorum TaxID=1890364 RepID=A0A2P6NKH8_9EUKA|nr:lactoylglutathione lyase-like lyase [Planoprotostelium fungivorum]
MPFNHIGITVSYVEKSRTSYGPALKPIEHTMLKQIPKEYTCGKTVYGYGTTSLDFWITGDWTNSGKQESKREEDTTVNRVAQYRPAYYSAFLFDSDGHNIEIFTFSSD